MWLSLDVDLAAVPELEGACWDHAFSGDCAKGACGFAEKRVPRLARV